MSLGDAVRVLFTEALSARGRRQEPAVAREVGPARATPPPRG